MYAYCPVILFAWFCVSTCEVVFRLLLGNFTSMGRIAYVEFSSLSPREGPRRLRMTKVSLSSSSDRDAIVNELVIANRGQVVITTRRD